MHVALVDTERPAMCNVPLLRDGSTRTWLIALAATILVGGGGAVGVGLYQRRAEDTRVRSEALPRCIERLADEPDCRRRIEAGHEDCAVYTRHFPGRFSGARSAVDADAYLECILLSPSGWVEEKRRRREAAQSERERDLSGR